MSSFHSDKCTTEELKKFRIEVKNWLEKHFDISNMKIRAFCCYNGDVRLYTGKQNEFQNIRSSFRKTETKKLNNGEIRICGTRGIHTTKHAEYFTFNRDEFNDIKKAWKKKKGFLWECYDDEIFRHLQIK